MQDVTKNREGELIIALKNLVKTQRELIFSISAKYKLSIGEDNSDDLSNVPWEGTISFDDHEWRFKRHGAGLSFYGAGSVEISAHIYPLSEPECFDAWRASLYLESIGMKKVIWDGEWYDVHYKPLEAILARMMSSKILRECGPESELYAFAQDVPNSGEDRRVKR